ncbi:kinase-like protein [Marasmius fiardii PR-910]|nr:kinase-like protein [Marasmius fiardii PR-910]
MAARKLDVGIDETLKKVSEGVKSLEDIYTRIHSSTDHTQRENLQLDLDTRIQELQSLDDQIKTLLVGGDNEHNSQLLEKRKLIETENGRFIALLETEKEISWLRIVVEKLQTQVERAEEEISFLQRQGNRARSSSSESARLHELERLNERRKWHIDRLEIILRLLSNGELPPEKVARLHDDVSNFVESNTEEDFRDDESIYDEFNLDEMFREPVQDRSISAPPTLNSQAPDDQPRIVYNIYNTYHNTGNRYYDSDRVGGVSSWGPGIRYPPHADSAPFWHSPPPFWPGPTGSSGYPPPHRESPPDRPFSHNPFLGNAHHDTPSPLSSDDDLSSSTPGTSVTPIPGAEEQSFSSFPVRRAGDATQSTRRSSLSSALPVTRGSVYPQSLPETSSSQNPSNDPSFPRNPFLKNTRNSGPHLPPPPSFTSSPTPEDLGQGDVSQHPWSSSLAGTTTGYSPDPTRGNTYQQPPESSSSQNLPNDPFVSRNPFSRNARNNTPYSYSPPLPNDDSASISEMERLSLSSPMARGEPGRGHAARREAGQDPPALQGSAPVAAETSRVPRGQSTSNETVTLEEDSKKLVILEAISHLLETVLKDGQRANELLRSIVEGEDAQLWLDTLQVLAKLPGNPTELRSSMLKMMLHFPKKSDLFPKCFIIENVEKVEEYPVAEGGFGYLWHGKIGQRELGLKVTKVLSTSNVQQLLKDYMREAIVWEQLEHPNLLPFMGMYYWNKTRTQLCLVCPWMEKGNLTNFLETTPREEVDHYLLVHDVASGLAYLHEKKIVHGDLKGVNVMITPEGRACIADFGLSRVVDSRAINLVSSRTNLITRTSGWSAPELLNPVVDSRGNVLPCRPSNCSDMYAFAGVCFEIFTGDVPFQGLSEAVIVNLVVYQNRHPPRPDGSWPINEMWRIMEECWDREPMTRPAASEVVARIAGLRCFKTFRPAPEWDMANLTLKNMKYTALDTEALRRLQRELKSFTRLR